MQEDNNIAGCLCSSFSYLNLIPLTGKVCGFFCHLGEKALDAMAGRQLTSKTWIVLSHQHFLGTSLIIKKKIHFIRLSYFNFSFSSKKWVNLFL